MLVFPVFVGLRLLALNVCTRSHCPRSMIAGELTQKRKAFSGAQKRMEDLDKIIQRLYEDSVLGKLSDLRFQKLSAQYETEQAEIQRLAVSLEREIENEAGQIADVGQTPAAAAAGCPGHNKRGAVL